MVGSLCGIVTVTEIKSYADRVVRFSVANAILKQVKKDNHVDNDDDDCEVDLSGDLLCSKKEKGPNR